MTTATRAVEILEIPATFGWINAKVGRMCDNESGPGGVGSTSRGLTHSLDHTKEGLA